jgi:hypothetical protein
VLELRPAPRYPILMDVPASMQEVIGGPAAPVRTNIGT